MTQLSQPLVNEPATSRQLLEVAIAARERLVTDTEAFQEIPHRWGRRSVVEIVTFDTVFDTVPGIRRRS